MTNRQTRSRDAGGKDQRPKGVTEKRVRGSDGRIKTMRVIDLSSQTLSDDLMFVFRKNVEKARRDNKRVTGSVDGIADKK